MESCWLSAAPANVIKSITMKQSGDFACVWASHAENLLSGEEPNVAL